MNQQNGIARHLVTGPQAFGRVNLRFVLLVLVPLAIVVFSGLAYVLGGRYVDSENAYVRADMVSVVPEVSGAITSVAVHENRRVASGDVLFTIDPARYQIAIDQAESELANVRTQIDTLKAEYGEKVQQLQTAQSNLAFAQREYRRQVELSRSHAVSDSILDSYRHKEQLAEQNVEQVRKGLDRLKAGLAGQPDIATEEHPRYRKALAALSAARQDLADTEVRARFDGIASQTPVVGQYAGPGHPAMSLVSSGRIWVEANLKETQLTHVEPGQPVVITVDAYPDLELEGRVASIAGATGSEFAVLPAQNATGNWVKVVQRIPVRIELDELPGERSLRSGMSVTVDIDTGWHHRGPEFLSPLTSWMQGVVGTAHAAEQAGPQG
ncbi:Multidrug resistance protein A [Marinobacter nitratireducens]|uniref:Multidrug resistance protein A n=1 Tax=Marinobacter nitratireducens TaxID=1137280 RepID=A0A072N6D6_9GAMM|nr:HlyD family secretion protein [Marinobacter nitratireducens]KEF32827.1 Multidrug resistance protein A [Marinobacter nitratireducens]